MSGIRGRAFFPFARRRENQLLIIATQVYAPPPGLWYVIAEVQGGGGNGAAATITLNFGLAGGGAGAYYSKIVMADRLPSAGVIITVGGVSGSSAFGTLIICTGGSSAAADQIQAANSGAASDSDFPGSVLGGIGSYGQPGTMASSGLATNSGAGGASMFGTPGPARIGIGAGGAASGYGAGGGGAYGDSTNPYAGGAGTPGCVRLTEVFF